jgi:hypothetical protein
VPHVGPIHPLKQTQSPPPPLPAPAEVLLHLPFSSHSAASFVGGVLQKPCNIPFAAVRSSNMAAPAPSCDSEK